MCIISSCHVTGFTYYGVMAEVDGDEVKLVTLPLGPKHQSRPTQRVNGEYADALWLHCTEEKLRGVVRKINPDKFNMAAGVDTTQESTVGRKRRSPPELCDPTPGDALNAAIVSLQSDLETEKKKVRKLEKRVQHRDAKIAEHENTIAKQKMDIAQLKKDVKKEKNKKPKTTPCTRCTTRAREETTPENNKTSSGGPSKQKSGRVGDGAAEMVRVLVGERDKNDKLVLNLTAQMTKTLTQVVSGVVQKW
jgi:uncharacterized coiled-coil protein SlyX